MDDKRQITAVVASSLDGQLLPLQLIFQGKTDASLPPHTDASTLAGFHLTKSQNHWSNQETMQEWCGHILVTWRDKMIKEHNLPANAAVVLQLNVWAVHISKEFRDFIGNKHPYVRLVYIPPNCTSKLQVADVVLNFPFKHGIKRRFNAWATELIAEQVANGEPVGIKPHLKMSQVKPKILQWALESWSSLREEKLLILKGGTSAWSRSMMYTIRSSRRKQQSRPLNVKSTRQMRSRCRHKIVTRRHHRRIAKERQRKTHTATRNQTTKTKQRNKS